MCQDQADLYKGTPEMLEKVQRNLADPTRESLRQDRKTRGEAGIEDGPALGGSGAQGGTSNEGALPGDDSEQGDGSMQMDPFNKFLVRLDPVHYKDLREVQDGQIAVMNTQMAVDNGMHQNRINEAEKMHQIRIEDSKMDIKKTEKMHQIHIEDSKMDIEKAEKMGKLESKRHKDERITAEVLSARAQRESDKKMDEDQKRHEWEMQKLREGAKMKQEERLAKEEERLARESEERKAEIDAKAKQEERLAKKESDKREIMKKLLEEGKSMEDIIRNYSWLLPEVETNKRKQGESSASGKKYQRRD